MSLLIESIKLLDGEFCNLAYHEARMQHSLSSLFGRNDKPELKTFLLGADYPRKGLYKCRILYDGQSRSVLFYPYEPRRLRTIRVVHDDAITYTHKYEDRRAIDRLFAMRNGCDDILIVRRGKVTDCSYSNVVFRKGLEWFTPEVPLLKGTMRQKLIDENKIRPKEILPGDIRSFDGLKVINAMLEFDSVEIEVSDIVF